MWLFKKFLTKVESNIQPYQNKSKKTRPVLNIVTATDQETWEKLVKNMRKTSQLLLVIDIVNKLNIQKHYLLLWSKCSLLIHYSKIAIPEPRDLIWFSFRSHKSSSSGEFNLSLIDHTIQYNPCVGDSWRA